MNCGGGLIQAITRKYTFSPIIGRGRDEGELAGDGLGSRNKGEAA